MISVEFSVGIFYLLFVAGFVLYLDDLLYKFVFFPF